MTVCAIGLLLFSLGIPQFLNAIDMIALDTETRGVQSTILRAQALTYADQEDRRLFLTKGHTGLTYSLDKDALPAVHIVHKRVSMMDAPYTTFRERDDQIKIIFKPSGWITGGTLTLKNRVGGRSRVVVQAVKGRVVIK